MSPLLSIMIPTTPRTLHYTIYLQLLSLVSQSYVIMSLKNCHLTCVFAMEGYNFTSSAVPLARPKYLHAHANVHFHETSIVVDGNQSAVATIAFHPPDIKPENEHAIYGGYIEIRSQNDEDDVPVHVPYIGAQGTQRDLAILDRNVSQYNPVMM